MLRKIILGLLLTIILLAIGGYIYYKVAIYEPPKISEADRASTYLMPLPNKLEYTGSYFKIDKDLNIQYTKATDKRLEKGLNRFLEQLGSSTGVAVANNQGAKKTFIIESETSWVERLSVENDESYTLEITKNTIRLKAPTPLGILHGFQTLLQLPEYQKEGVVFPTLKIEDAPRFPWRGLMLDVSRHWISKEAVLRQLDGMAANKMNVFHWHLTDYQGFRVESKVYPKLHEMGSDGNFYTQEEIKEVIAYAMDRGIRVIPEFDLPGHATSWFVGYPELATAPGSYTLDKKFGVLNPVMDPTKNGVYRFLDTFFQEMATLFPDEYIHIGGDEVHTHDWENSKTVQAFMKAKGWTEYNDLQNHFNGKVQRILEKHGKKMMGWDEILHPSLDENIIVQSWRSHKSLFEALQRGGTAILSNGYYLDHKLSAGKHYSVDPAILPGAVDIEPDPNNWETWDITVNFGEGEIESSLTLFGEGEERRGFFALMDGGNMAFQSATRTADKLNFKFLSDYGEIAVNADITDNTMTGKMGLGLLKMPFTGELSGSNDIAGTSPPTIERIKPLTEEEKSRLLGGEACMWTEVATEDNIDSRIWPRTAAIAEKFWSLEEHTKDIEDMYRRLDAMDGMLTDLGLLHHDNYNMQVEMLALGGNGSAMKTFMDVIEEVKYYDRMSMYDNLTTETELEGIAHTARPESFLARHFNQKVAAYLAGEEVQLEDLQNSMTIWRNNHDELKATLEANEEEAALKLSENLMAVAAVGLNLLDHIENEKALPPNDYDYAKNTIAQAKQPHGGAIIAIVEGIEKLLAAAQKTEIQ